MTELSPAAQTVLDAYIAGLASERRNAIAAALHAAVNQVAPENTFEGIDYVHQSYVDGYRDALNEIRSIANEL